MSEESYYKIIPESEVEPQKLQKTKKIIERFRNHVKETTGCGLSEFQLKWVKLTKKELYDSDQVYHKLLDKERHDVQNKLAELKILAAHRAGRILKEMAERGERLKAGGEYQQLANQTAEKLSLQDLNISRYQSHTWQKIAELEGFKCKFEGNGH